jgi:hypothetical protein
MVVSKLRITEIEDSKEINSKDYDLFSNKDFRYPILLIDQMYKEILMLLDESN